MTGRASQLSSYATHGWRVLSNADGRRRHSARRLEYEVLGRFTSGLLAEDHGLVFLVNTSDKVVGGAVFCGGSDDIGVASMRSTLAAVDAALGRPALEGKVFVDVGANIGTSTVAALTQFGASRSVAIEPAPANVRLLKCNLILNSVEDRAAVIHAAVAPEAGTLLLELSDVNSGDHRIRVGDGAGGEFGESSWSTVEVPALPLADALATARVDIDDVGLIWVDVQGFEAQVLRSAGPLLGAVPVVLEYGPYWVRRVGDLASLHELIAAHYRRVVDLRSGESLETAQIARLESVYVDTSYTDLLLLP